MNGESETGLDQRIVRSAHAIATSVPSLNSRCPQAIERDAEALQPKPGLRRSHVKRLTRGRPTVFFNFCHFRRRGVADVAFMIAPRAVPVRLRLRVRWDVPPHSTTAMPSVASTQNLVKEE